MGNFTPYWSTGWGGAAASFNIQYRLEGTMTWTTITGLTGYNTTIDVLIGGTYEWQIQAVNIYGTSAWSVSQFCVATGGSSSVDVADTFFAPTAGFVDLTVSANRRAFYSATGGAVFLGANGSLPFGTEPPVFLRSTGTAATFAGNNGAGGAFAVTGGSLTNSATNPPGTSGTTTTYQTNTPAEGVVGDYLTGNLYAYNPDGLTDNGTPRRWLRRWRALPEGNEGAKRFSTLVLDMQTGIDVDESANPQCVLRWTDDAGRTWQGNRIEAVGVTGQTSANVKFNRLGMTRRYQASDRFYELSSTDAFPVVITNAEVEVE